MLTSGDVVELDFGIPAGSKASLRRPAIVITAERVLQGGPNVIHVVPLTNTIRTSSTEITIDPEPENGLTAPSAAQCQHIRAIATARVSARIGKVGPITLRQVRSIVATIIDA